MGTTLGGGFDLDQDKTLACRTLGASPRHATPRLEDGTPYSNDHATRWSHQDAGAISARLRTTATPDAIPRNILSTVLDHCTPAIRGKDDDFHDLLCKYTAPPCVYKRRRRAFP